MTAHPVIFFLTLLGEHSKLGANTPPLKCHLPGGAASN